MTHITKEALLQKALKELIKCARELDQYGSLMSAARADKVIAEIRAAELSAQESKPVAWETVGTVDNLSGYVRWKILPGDMSSGTVLYRAAPPVSAQDASPKDGWQPIETAPINGEPIFAFWKGPPVCGANFGVTLYANGSWRSAEEEREDDEYREPDFWMPLPEPPQ